MPEVSLNLEETEDDVLKEMFGGSIPRVDAVKGPATGLLFTVLKAGSAQDQPTFPTEETAVSEPTEETVTKAADAVEEAVVADADEVMDDATAGAAGSEAPTEAAGDPDDPESPAWEAVDAARARQAVNMVVGLQRLVSESLAREAQEAVLCADAEDDENAFDLSCVLDALDCVLDTLAPFAVGEQAESEEREANAVSVVTKAGRVLSSANEERIQAAVKSLQSVLASLPAATEPEGGPMADTDTEAVTKADKSLMAVYSQGGKLLGVVDPEKITAVATGDEGDEEPADADDAPAAEEAAPAADETEAAPAADEAAPAAPAAAPAAEDEDAAAVAKSQDVAEVVEAAVTKALEAEREEHSSVLKALEERLAAVEAQPMPGGPLLSGATGAGAPILRGQDAGVTSPEVDAVRKALDAETDPARQADLRRHLTFLAMKGAYSA